MADINYIEIVTDGAVIEVDDGTNIVDVNSNSEITVEYSGDSKDANAIRGRTIETGTPADQEVLTWNNSASEWQYQTVDENVDDQVASLIQASSGNGITWTYDDSAGTLTPTLSIKNADVNASAAIAVSKLAASTVNYGGVTLTLGGSDTTPAFNLSDATAYVGDSSLVTTGVVNSGSISDGHGSIDIGSSALTAGTATFSGDIVIDATDKIRLDGSASGNTYLSESSADVVTLTTEGLDSFLFASNGGNPYLRLQAGNNGVGAIQYYEDDGGSGQVLKFQAGIRGADNKYYISSNSTIHTNFAIQCDGEDVAVGGELSGNAATFTQVDITGEGDLRLQDNSGGQYVGLDAPSSVSSSYTLTMPSAVGSVNQVLSLSNTDGTLAWSTPEVGDITAVTAGDGLSGGGTSGAVSLALDLNELTAATVNVANDSIAIVDASDSNTSRKETIADLMSAVDGTGLTASSGVLSVDASQTQITAVGALGAGSIASGFTSISTSYTDAKVTSVVAGTLIDVSATTGAVTVNVDLSELATSTSDADGDFFAVVDSSNAQKKLTKGNIDLAGFGGTAATATLASTITVTANNATSETVYPLFVDGATGTQGAESDTGLNYNPSSGILTTTQVTGNLLGDVTGNVSGSSGSTTGNAATATVSSTSVVVDSSDASAFPAFFDSATGSLAIKTDASGLTYNATTGVLSAGFAGALTGNVTGNVSGTSATVTGASQSNITSVGTLTSLAISGDATVGDDLSLISDAAVLNFGENSDVSLTHVHDIGLLLNSSMQLQFGDNQSYIQQSGDGTLRINGEGVLDLYGSTMVALSNDVRLNSDASVLGFGVNNDVTLTHVHDTGLLLNSTMAIQFNDASQYINAPTATVLDINATDEIELNATTIDINGAVDISGAVQVGSTITVGVDDAGHDVKFFGNTASAYMLWDTSDDDLILGGAAGLVVPDGKLTLASTAVTSTGAELNILDGVTSTTAELNILDGVTSTTAELNILDGVTSTAAELNILDGVTSSTAELNILDGVTSTTAELNILDGATVVVGEINYLDLGATAVGNAIASKAVVLDSNKDYTGIRNLTITGELDAATLDISGSIDVAGTANLDAVDIDGNVNLAGYLDAYNTIYVTRADNSAGLQLICTDADAGSGPLILLDRNTASPADGDTLGKIYSQGRNDADQLVTYSHITTKSIDVSDTTEDGEMLFNVMVNGTDTTVLDLYGPSTQMNTTTFDLNGALDVSGTSTLTGNVTTGADIIIPATNKIYLDGGGNTFLHESSADTVTLTTEGANAFVFAAGGGNPSMQLHAGAGGGTGTVEYYEGTDYFWQHGVRGADEKWYLTGNATLHSSYALMIDGQDVAVGGALSKGSGSFKIDHVLPSMESTHDLYHSFVESSECLLIYRGSIELENGQATIQMDDEIGLTTGTFELLVRDAQVYTTNETSFDRVRGSIDGSVMTIECENSDCADVISWLVVGERMDKHIMETSWTDDDGRPILEREKPPVIEDAIA